MYIKCSCSPPGWYPSGLGRRTRDVRKSCQAREIGSRIRLTYQREHLVYTSIWGVIRSRLCRLLGRGRGVLRVKSPGTGGAELVGEHASEFRPRKEGSMGLIFHDDHCLLFNNRCHRGHSAKPANTSLSSVYSKKLKIYYVIVYPNKIFTSEK